MLLERLKEISLEIGFERNLVTEKKETFSYKKEIWIRRKLIQTGTNIISESKFELKFIDALTDSVCSLFVTERNNLIYVDFSGTLPEDINCYWLTFPRNSSEHIYGCGKSFSKFDLNGEVVKIWVGDSYFNQFFLKKNVSCCVQPTFVSSEKYFVHGVLNSYAEFDFRKKNKITMYFQEEPHLVLAEAKTFSKLSKKLGEVIGVQTEIPEWIFDGVIISAQNGFSNVEKKLSVAENAGIKVNGIWVQDWCGGTETKFGYQTVCNWKSDDEKYPNLKEKIAELNKKGIHFLGYISPFLDISKDAYKEAKRLGYCIKNKDGEDYIVSIVNYPCALIDFTNPSAYEWFKDIIKNNIIRIGMSGWMADFGEYLPLDCVLSDKTPVELIHNKWPAIWAKLNREAIEECGKQNEVFFFTRTGYTGTVSATTMMWTGAQCTDWRLGHGISSVITATLSLAMSGYGITHSEVGGYVSIERISRSKELLMRWSEMNVFSPLWRHHEGNEPLKNAQFDSDEELLDHTAKCSKMHVALKNYLKAVLKEEEKDGIPMMRPLFYHYEEEKAFSEKTEYLLGKDVLVCPILEKGKTSRKCYLPDDYWINVFSKSEYKGGTFEIKAEIGKPAVFVRRDSKWKELLLSLSEI